MPRTTKLAKASTNAAEKIQDESSVHAESSSSDQGVVYACDKSICSHSEDCSSIDE